MKKFLIVWIVALFTMAPLVAQTESQFKRMAEGKPTVKPDELVSFRADVPYSEAIKSLSEICKRLTGKMIVDNSATTGADKTLGVNIESMFWKDALELILRSNKLWYNEYPEYFEVMTMEELSRRQQMQEAAAKRPAQTKTDAGQQPAQQLQPPQAFMQPKEVLVDSGEVFGRTPEIIISSIFIELNQSKIREKGFSLSVFRGKDANVGVEFIGADKVTTPIMSVSANPSSKNLTVDLSTALKVFEGENIGEVIARPQMIVRSGSSGYLQSGQDFSIKQKDFSGNVTDQFIKTGIILTVTPKVYKINGIDFIDLSYIIEKSSASPGAVSSIVNRTEQKGRLGLLNGEESYVAGLYSNEETVIRQGIPVLKDLPWWVFGLRYLFGYDQNSVTKKELIVVLKAELVPMIEDRAASRTPKNVVPDKFEEMRKDLERRQKAIKK
jgi:type IV pilus assembly protein PilQ